MVILVAALLFGLQDSVSVPVSHRSAPRVVELLDKAQVGVKNGELRANEQSRAISIRAAGARLNELKKLVAAFDVEPTKIDLNITWRTGRKGALQKADFTLENQDTNVITKNGETLRFTPSLNDNDTISLKVRAAWKQGTQDMNFRVRNKLKATMTIIPKQGPDSFYITARAKWHD